MGFFDLLAWSEASNASSNTRSIEEKIDDLIKSQQEESKLLLAIAKKLDINI